MIFWGGGFVGDFGGFVGDFGGFVGDFFFGGVLQVILGGFVGDLWGR